ncbi:MAG: YfiR family protein [Calditrichaceae bacterium]|nr:YfiR family protein [Calditrichaceae bacterium]MBN2707832.1 YfiR family protein [Calditrichaceae bacterium]RQV94898.1 MAG: YfiR family protein [Calditrichota bacterium]
MKFKNMLVTMTMLSLILSLNSPIFAQTKEAPAPIAAALLVKVIGFEKNISAGDITIYVLGSSDVAKELKKVIGQANIKAVESGNSLPSSKPTILFIADEGKLNEAVKYTQDNKILSVTNIPELVEKGATLGFGIGSDNKPKILLNINSSAKEGLDWNPAIMKVAQVIK